VDSTTQKTYSKKSDDDFSKEIFRCAQLKRASSVDDNFGSIINSFGSLLQDSKGNIFFDTRIYSGKPSWGHNHPIVVRYKDVKIAEVVNDFEKDQNLDSILIKQLKNYEEIVLIKGNRKNEIIEIIKNYFLGDKVILENLTLSFIFQDKEKALRLSSQNCLLISNENFQDLMISFDIMTAITNDQLISCLSGIKKVYEGVACS
jgi:hypothetical protein